MSALGQEKVRKNRRLSRQFNIARTNDDLYDAQKAPERLPRQDLIAKARAIIVVALAGGVIWFLCWKVATSFLGRH
jgi:ferric-dicitrate binding protein FerR (iron transport regulator)